MTNPAAPFLARICETPADDAPRGVYADWLTENGEAERGEFIRVGCEVEPLRRAWAEYGPFLPDAESHYQRLETREQELLQVNADRWFSLPGLTACSVWDHSPTIRLYLDEEEETSGGSYIVGCDAARGFVGSVTCTAADWLAHGDTLSWSPKMTEPCPVFASIGRQNADAGFVVAFHQADCPTCKGTGRVPRPCPATAHPITEVRLTTWPTPDEMWTQLAADHPMARGSVPAFLSRRWPAVEKWELPPEPVFNLHPAQRRAFDEPEPVTLFRGR